MLNRRSLALFALGSILTACSSCEEPRTEPAPPSEAPAEERLTEQSFRLPNGLEVALVAGPCGGDRAAVVVLLEVGADHDPPGRSGMAHVVARLLSPPGASAQVTTGRDHTLYSVVVESDRLLDALDDIATWLAGVELTEAELGRARTEVLEELTRRHGGAPELTATSYAAESVRPSRGEGWRGGIAAEVEAIELADVDAFLRARFAAGNARMIVAGRHEPQAIRSRIETAFAALPSGTAPALREPGASTVTGTLVMGDAPSALAIAVPAPAPPEPLYPAFLILAARLMADDDLRSWDVTYDPLTEPETLFVSGPLEPAEQPDPAAARVRRDIDAVLSRPLSTDDLAAARERFGLFLGVDALDPATCAEDPRALAMARARRAQLGLSDLRLLESLEATTEEQLAEAATLFGPRRSAAVIAGGTIR